MKKVKQITGEAYLVAPSDTFFPPTQIKVGDIIFDDEVVYATEGSNVVYEHVVDLSLEPVVTNLDALLDDAPTAAGLTGQEGHSFVRLERVDEDVTPLKYIFIADITENEEIVLESVVFGDATSTDGGGTGGVGGGGTGGVGGGGTGGVGGGGTGGGGGGSEGPGQGPRGNNGFGNGDQNAPGNSGPHNNAENAADPRDYPGNSAHLNHPHNETHKYIHDLG